MPRLASCLHRRVFLCWLVSKSSDRGLRWLYQDLPWPLLGPLKDVSFLTWPFVSYLEGPLRPSRYKSCCLFLSHPNWLFAQGPGEVGQEQYFVHAGQLGYSAKLQGLSSTNSSPSHVQSNAHPLPQQRNFVMCKYGKEYLISQRPIYSPAGIKLLRRPLSKDINVVFALPRPPDDSSYDNIRRGLG